MLVELLVLIPSYKALGVMCVPWRNYHKIMVIEVFHTKNKYIQIRRYLGLGQPLQLQFQILIEHGQALAF